MTRREKYPDTDYFHFHNANPKNRFTTDCVVRAISTATKRPYEQVVRELADLQIATGYDTSAVECYGKYLESLGWIKHKQPRKTDGRKYTGKEFCKELWKTYDYRRIVANLGGNHVVAIIEGAVNDTWDSTDGCIGNYWTEC